MRTANDRINPRHINDFKRKVWHYYRTYGRHEMVWRHTRDPYKVLISEIMLQQTQVARVEKFYPKFVKAFPNFRALSMAPLKSVLRVWQGMGYNRRVIALKKIARKIDTEYHGILPNDIETLKLLPGIGGATAGALMAYAFNKPAAFVETNVRRVFIYYFFTRRHPGLDPGSRKKKQTKKRIDVSARFLDSRFRGNDKWGGSDSLVSDREILRLVEQTLDRKNPREWYWALMDYGTMLAAREKENPNVRSARYRKQSKFEGSRRQLRGRVLRLLLKEGNASKVELDEFGAVLPELLREGFIKESTGRYWLV